MTYQPTWRELLAALLGGVVVYVVRRVWGQLQQRRNARKNKAEFIRHVTESPTVVIPMPFLIGWSWDASGEMTQEIKLPDQEDSRPWWTSRG